MRNRTLDWSVSRRKALKGIAVSGATLGLATTVSAQPSECTLDWRKALNQHKPSGDPAVNAKQKVVNGIDSGFNGYWANLDYNRTLRAWNTGEGEYEVIAMYTGQFDGVEGRPSPGEDGGDPLSGREDGTFHGGYAATVTADLLEGPEWSLRGNIGTIDYEGDVATGAVPGYVDWIAEYFGSGYGFSYDWWGWIYRSGECGTWVNAQDPPGSCGDILCE